MRFVFLVLTLLLWGLVTVLHLCGSVELDQALLATMGRFHMVILHLPIGLLFGVILSELWHLWQRKDERGQGHLILLAATFLSSIAAVVCGYLLSWEPSYDLEAIRLHRLGGLCVAYFSGLSLLGLLFFKSYKFVYYLSLGVLCYAIYYTGHEGGALTHGSNFLTAHLDRSTISDNAVGLPDTIFYQAIQPQLDSYCTNCHGPDRARANLRLDSFEALLAGGNRGEVVIPGEPERSSLVAFMLLPLDDGDHMPPNGKLQPDPEVAELIHWWIQTGASESSTVDDHMPPPALASFFIDREELHPIGSVQLEDLLAANDYSPFKLYPFATGDARLTVSASNATDADLEKLHSIRANIVVLELSNSPITDLGLEHIKGLTNLKHLRLNNTKVTDAGTPHISSLYQLNTLNLASTEISDSGLKPLERITSLQKVYLWNTKVSVAAAENLKQKLYPKIAAERLRSEMEALKHRMDALRITVDTGI